MTKENMYLLQNSLLLNQKILSDVEYNYLDITKIFKLGDSITLEEVDRFIAKSISDYKKYLLDIEVNLDDLYPLFIVEDVLSNQDSVNITTDEMILSKLSEYNKSEIGIKYSEILIDKYQIGYLSRFKKVSSFEYYGQVSKELLNSSSDMQTILKNSVYYKDIIGDSPKTIDRLFDEYLIKKMKEYQYHNIGINGIFSNVFFKMMEIKNIRIVLKSHLNHLNYEDSVRVLNG